MEEGHLIDSLTDFYGISSQGLAEEDIDHHKKSLAFIITNLLADKFEKVEDQEDFYPIKPLI